MKKYFSIFALALVMGLGFASCSTETDEPAGGTKVEKMAGHWVVNTDLIDGTDTIPNVYADYGIVDWDMTTYNTANDDKDLMWLSDNNNFWGYTLKVPIDLDAMTFAVKDGFIYEDEDEDGNPIDINCTISNGKIIENGGLNVNGKPTDAIEYDITFDDDGYGFVYHVHGVRYAGF